MITLYNVPVSSYGAKVRIILQHKGLDWTEAAPPDGYGSATYKRIVPAGTVPAIIHGGLTLADSEAIAEYLDESFPTPPMMPAVATARARARELSRFHDTRLEPVLRSFFGQVAPSGRDATFIAETGALLQARLDRGRGLRPRRGRRRPPAPSQPGAHAGCHRCAPPAAARGAFHRIAIRRSAAHNRHRTPPRAGRATPCQALPPASPPSSTPCC